MSARARLTKQWSEAINLDGVNMKELWYGD
jgi:hypothetical protein